MKKKSYYDQLKDSRWQEKRLELLQAAGFKCQSQFCDNKEDHPQLSIHHKLYLRNTNLWEYEPWAYIVLCGPCHEKTQQYMEMAHTAIAKNADLFGVCILLSEMDKYTVEKFCAPVLALALLTKGLDNDRQHHSH